MKASLSQRDIEIDERDFFRDPFTEDELRGLLGNTPPSEIFSWRSPSMKKMNLNKDELSNDDLIRLMVQEPRLVRRPLIEVNGQIIVGSDKQAMSEAFPEA